MIKTKNLTRVYETINYNVVALSNLNFEFEKGEVVVVLGRSGSGKSTFLNILGGFDHDYSGSYYFGKYEFKSMETDQVDELRSTKIGFIFQHQVLFNNLTVVENVEMALNVLGVENTRKKRLNAMKALTLVGLRRHAFKKPWQLSGGEKQRVAIARAIVKDPDVIICDEPTAALDSVTSKEILDLLASVCKDKLLIIATHNKSIVKNYGTRLLEFKSGYVVRDELIKEDKSNVETDVLDQLVDEALYEENKELKTVSTVTEKNVSKSDSKILTDLDLSGYKSRKEETFLIDETEKEDVLKRRRKNVKKEEQFDSFDGTNQSMTSIKRYAVSSLFNQKRTYSFLGFFLVTFIFIMIIGLNLSSRLLLKTDNTQDINRKIYEQNKLIKFSDIDQIDLLLEDVQYEDSESLSQQLKEEYTQNTNLNSYSDQFNPVILNDASFNLDYQSELFSKLELHLDENGYRNDYAQYYDLNNIAVGKKNDEVFFTGLQQEYKVHKIEEPLTIRKIVEEEVNLHLSYLYIENNYDIMKHHLIGDSQIPRNDDEVLMSVKMLIDFNVIENESNNISSIYEQFMNLEDEKRVIEISTPVITVKDDENGDPITSESQVINRYKIVGIYHAGDDIESYYVNKSSEHRMLFFSKQASNQININIQNESNKSNVKRIPLYMEINKQLYEDESIDTVIKSIQQDLLEEYSKAIDEEANVLKEPLLTALQTLNNQLVTSTSLTHSQQIDSTYFDTLTYGDVLYEYSARFLATLDYRELNELCNNCIQEDEEVDQIKQKLPSIFTTLNQNSKLYNQMISSMGNVDKLITEETINSMIYDSYHSKFNNTYYSIFVENDALNYESLVLTHENDLEKGSYYGLSTMSRSFINEHTPLKIDEESEGFSRVVITIGKLIIDPNLIMTIMATVASSALIIVILYVFSYIIAKLFGDLYQLSFINRQKEFISLKILGAKFADIKRIIKLEGNLFVLITYGFVVVLLGVIHLIMLATKDSNAFMLYLYEKSTELFININVFDFIGIHILTLFNVMILMKLLFKKQLIDHNIDKKFKSIDSIDSIRDWDGE